MSLFPEPARAVHNRAMDKAYFADRARANGDDARADQLFGEALEAELRAIELLEQPKPLAFALLHRSAAWLSIECGNFTLAEELSETGLANSPPPPVDWQLLEVRDRARSDAARIAADKAPEPGRP